MLQLPTQPWTLAECASRDQRDQLASFWLAAPEDLLPILWSSSAGEVTSSMIRSLAADTVFTSEQVAIRNSIGERLSSGLNFPGAIQLLLANFLYSPPGLMKIANPESQLPDWLLHDYKNIYEQYNSYSSLPIRPRILFLMLQMQSCLRQTLVYSLLR